MPRRRVIALLTNAVSMRSDYQGLLRQGIEQACVERDIDLWVYAGRSDWRACGPAQAHVYRLVSSDRIDGIIVAAGCIAATLPMDELLGMLQKQCPVPTCFVSQLCPTVPSIIVDNTVGPAQLADHFVTAHGRRRFAYIAGPAGHEESEQRLLATRDALALHSIPLPPSAVAYGTFSAASGIAAARELFFRSQEFDALIAANDDMAVGALEALSAIGLRCPEDVAVAGFDDAPSSRTCSPTLTTVRQPIAQLGAMAVAHVISAWQGDTLTNLPKLDTEIVCRDSCGCRLMGKDFLQDNWNGSVATRQISEAKVAEALAPLAHCRFEREQWAKDLCDALDAECRGKIGSLSQGVQTLLNHFSHPDAPLHELQHAITYLRAVSHHPTNLAHLEDAFHDAIIQVGQTVDRREGKRRQREDTLTEQIRSNWEHLASSLDLPALSKALVDQLPHLSIRNGFVAVYARDNPDLLVPLACVTDGQPVTLAEQPYPAQWLLPEHALITHNRSSLAVLPLTCEWEQLGVAVLELPHSHEIYAVLREQIGSAVKTALLHEDMLKQAHQNALVQEEKRVTAERLRSLSLIAGGVAHDLNNVLGPLVGLPEIMARDLEREFAQNVPASVTEDLDAMRQAGLRAADTIRDLLTLGQPSVGPKTTIELNRLMAREERTITALGERAHPITIQIVKCDKALFVHASAIHVVRAITNLVVNAADAIQSSGTITIRCLERVLSEPIGGVETVEPGQYAVVEVKDTGAGIAPENLGHILEPFFTSRQPGRRKGTGLGLAIVHSIIRDSQGYVHVQSTLGQGSTFSLFFPLQQRAPVGQSSFPAPAPGGRERILVVDDEPVQLRTARRILTQLGYSVVTAESGTAALELWQDRQSLPTFELIILDMMMPGPDGLATLAQIRKLHPKQKALIVTGYTPQHMNQLNANQGVIWLAKPYTPTTLGNAVRRALDG